jgi:uncharacterized protein YndB with AHSA1/START domain
MFLMHTIQQDYVIKAPISQVWQAFTTAEMAEQWGAGPAKVEVRVGDDELKSMGEGWADYYFDPMKSLLEK